MKDVIIFGKINDVLIHVRHRLNYVIVYHSAQLLVHV